VRDRLPHARLRRQARRSAQSLLHLRRRFPPRDARRGAGSGRARRPRFRTGDQGGERMKLGFVVDPLDHLKPYKDSSVAMMREASRRGHEIHAFEAREMFVREGSVRATMRRLEVSTDDAAWYRAAPDEQRAVGSL